MQHNTVEAAIAAIDARLGLDPNGLALDYAKRMSKWLTRLHDEPSDVLAVAVRGQHFERWKYPRGSYPAGRKGYLAWRRAAATAQAGKLAALLTELGFDDAYAARVTALVKKDDLGGDPEVQVLEDCACLVFLEASLAEFSGGRRRGQVVAIVRKTWRKMSPAAQRHAAEIRLTPESSDLLSEALRDAQP